jgi:transposase
MSKPAKNPQLLPAPETESLPKRRAFTAEYKARILAECDAATEAGQIGEILRREGLYSSHLTDWRRRRADGGLQGLEPKKSGRPPKNPTTQAADKELERLRRENARLEEKLRRSQLIIDAQKKLAELLDSLREKNGSDA